MKKDNLVYLKHISDAILRIEDYTEGLKYEDFMKNNLVQAGVMREITVIREAAKRLTRDIREKYSDIPWKKIAGMRDKLIHNYFDIKPEIAWKTVKEDIPKLKLEMTKLLKNR